MFLAIAFIGYSFLAVVALLDKLIVEKAVYKPAVFAFYSAALSLPFIFFLPFSVSYPLDSMGWIVAAVSGVSFVLGLWTSYKSLANGEVSHAGPLMGAAIPFFTVIASPIFLGEVLSQRQLVAIAVLIFGSLIIAVERSGGRYTVRSSVFWAIAAGLMFAISNMTGKYLYDSLGFYSGFVLTRVAIGVLGLLLLILPSVWHDLWHHPKQKKARHTRRVYIYSNRILATIGVLLVQYAIAIGSVSAVSAMETVKYGMLIVLVAFLSKFFPKIFSEEYTKLEIAMEVIAVVLIGVGLVLLV